MSLTNDIARPLALVSLAAVAGSWPAPAQDPADVQIETVRAAENVYMLAGSGGNIGLSVGTDGAFLIDDQYAPLTQKIKASVAALTDQPIRFVVNTHWHGDHTGGNENLGEAGALIVAHENVRARMSVEQFIAAFDRRYPPAPPRALPVITFTESVTFHWNGDEIHVFHVDPAHTDGDAIIRFTNANVIHMGDTYFNRSYPFIDVSTGGSLDGVIAAVDRVLRYADGNTVVIPGHGPISNRTELRTYRDLLVTVRDRIARLIAQGEDRAAVIAAKPTSDFDTIWGRGFLQPDQWVGLVFDAMRGTSGR